MRLEGFGAVILLVISVFACTPGARQTVSGTSGQERIDDSAPAQVRDVTAFGAVADAGRDDTAAIQAAIDAAAPGDTIYFPRGTYEVSTLALKSAVTYQGAAGAVLHAETSRPMITVDRNDSHHITIDGLTFDGATVLLIGTRAGGSVDHVTITHSIFENVTAQRWDAAQGLYLSGLKNSRIVGNTFRHINGKPGGRNINNGIVGYDLENTVISANTFTDDFQGISLFFNGRPGTGNNIVLSDNVGIGTERMGIEISGSNPAVVGETRNLLVERNRFTRWNNPNPRTDGIGLSVVAGGGIGTKVSNNYLQGGGNAYYGIELAGKNALAQGNYIDGFATGIVVYSPGATVADNNVINWKNHAYENFFNSPGVTFVNDTSDPTIPAPAVTPGLVAPTSSRPASGT